MSASLLSVKDISKSFGPVRALAGMHFELEAGEVHALMGENGAGKSTLMNILGGVLKADAGEIVMKGKVLQIASPAAAQALGIGLVHQEIALCPDVSVAENIFMAETNGRRRLWMDATSLRRRAEAVLADLHPVPVTALAGELPIASQQIVEIAKALTLNCEVLIFDEPTAALTETEASALFAIIGDLKARGIGIVYISHRMAEIFAIADRITVVRDGAYVATFDTGATTPEEIASTMVGRPILDLYPPQRAASHAPPMLRIEGLSDGGIVRDVSFEVRPGEIVGLGGLIGSGRTEIAQALCGLAPRTAGRIFLDGAELAQTDYRASIRAGIVYLSEDRKGDGIFLDLSIAQNISALDLKRVSGAVMVRRSAEVALAEQLRQRLDIRCASVHQPVGTLSGGNQQKVALAKLLAVGPRVLFVDEPTRGVDIGAKAQIYAILRELADLGAGIVAISSELPELIGISDRILVLHEGRLAGEVTGDEMTEDRIIQLASGLGGPMGTLQ
ncbi:D-xylose ABC transporter ATP-binding protein [Kaistia algarum]|uniref:sugar ABC transporter ATP-binding protein n=1 Tax=Kaistia algarum TaxID=2083279 RepID=UPI000CE81839|nr:sugar ABC transporter ATP-binding protein [Kaistia algarum]MCX5515368.1 sugar ABC transporter ATP-binding protein [Kaistia algarum]PPE77835.1 D-xylose ABC transporter ATP-binding protein [Kaistia algarum]